MITEADREIAKQCAKRLLPEEFMFISEYRVAIGTSVRFGGEDNSYIGRVTSCERNPKSFTQFQCTYIKE